MWFCTWRVFAGHGHSPLAADRGRRHQRPGNGKGSAAGHHHSADKRDRGRSVGHRQSGRSAGVARRQPAGGTGVQGRRRSAPRHDVGNKSAFAVGRRAQGFHAPLVVPGLQRRVTGHRAPGMGKGPRDRFGRSLVPQPAVGAEARRKRRQTHRVLGKKK